MVRKEEVGNQGKRKEMMRRSGFSMSFGELAAAEGLVVHRPFFYQGVAAFLKASAAPVLVPPEDFLGRLSRKIFGGQRGSGGQREI